MKLAHPDYMTSAFWFDKKHAFSVVYKGEQAYLQAYDGGVELHAPIINNRIEAYTNLRINPTGDRDPDWRATIRERLGVGFDLASEFSKQLVCPHTGRVIPVSRIEDNPVLLVDYEHKVALKAGMITYDSPDARPVKWKPDNPYHRVTPIRYSFATNKKRYDEDVVRFKALVNEAKTRLALCPDKPTENYEPTNVVERIVKLTACTSIESVAAAFVPAGKHNIDEFKHMMVLCNTLVNYADLYSGGVPVKYYYEQLRDKHKLACADHYEAEELIWQP